jgi:Flp pilus assembly pilin Flp
MENEKGQTTTEYGLILMIVSIAVIAVLAVAVGNLTSLFQNAGTLVHNAIASV